MLNTSEVANIFIGGVLDKCDCIDVCQCTMVY